MGDSFCKIGKACRCVSERDLCPNWTDSPSAMRYDDPIRPKLSDGRPMYLHDRPLAALPRLDIEPDGTGWDISIMLKVDSNSFSWFHARPQNEEELIGLLRDWKLDPEGVLLRWFGYSGPKGERELDIEDFL